MKRLKTIFHSCIFVVLIVIVSYATAAQFISLPSALRIGDITGDTITKVGESSATFVLKITSAPGGTDTLTMRVEGITATGAAYTIVTGSAQTASGVTALYVGTGVATTANTSAGIPLPDLYRAIIAQSGVASGVYEVTVNTSR